MYIPFLVFGADDDFGILSKSSPLPAWLHVYRYGQVIKVMCIHIYGTNLHVQASVELGPEDVSLLERCPHFRGWYVQASMELGPEDVSLLERCPHFGVCTGFNGVGT